MTQEKRTEAIKWLKEEIRSLRLAPKINGCGPENWADLLEVMETCLEAVRGYGSEPLTMEQLREMDGQPVWVQTPGIEKYGRWAIVAGVNIEDKVLYCQGDYTCRDYGRVWIAYGYPTAHIDWEAWSAEWEEDGECNHKPYRVRDAEKWKKYKCSKCGYKAGRRTSQKYCPSCGRAMTPGARDELKKRIREGELYGEMPILWL